MQHFWQGRMGVYIESLVLFDFWIALNNTVGGIMVIIPKGIMPKGKI